MVRSATLLHDGADPPPGPLHYANSRFNTPFSCTIKRPNDELPATIQLSDGLLDPGGSRRGRVCALTHGCVPHFRVRSCGVITCQVCSTSMPTHANAPIDLPPPIAAYFAADTSDANA